MADFTIKRNDTAPPLPVTLRDSKGPIDLTTAKAVHVYLKSATKLIKTGPMTITSAAAGEVEYAWANGDTAFAGEYKMEFEITWGDDTVQTVPNSGYLDLEIEEDLGQPSDLE